jgi:diguanylate cyclase (GGDEF)-like protein
MRVKMRIFLLVTAAILTILIIVGAMQAKYEEKRLFDELKARARSVAEVAEISARIFILDGRTEKLSALIAGFEDKQRTQGCIFYDYNGKVMTESRSFKNANITDAENVKRILKGTRAEFIKGTDDGLEVLKYIIPILYGTTTIGAVEVIYDMSYINTSIYRSWQRLGIMAIIFIFVMSIFIFDFIEKTFFLPEKKVKEMIEKIKSRRIVDKFGILKDFKVLMENFEDTSVVKMFVDEKTGLKNYRFYKNVIAPVLESCQETMLAIMDIDNFKNVNTIYGHDAGDRVIKAVSNILKRYNDDACRYGGEEFVFISGGSAESFSVLCGKIREDIEKEAGREAGIDASITVSIGTAAGSEAEMIYKDEKERAVFRIADKRLIRAKETGKNRILTKDQI